MSLLSFVELLPLQQLALVTIACGVVLAANEDPALPLSVVWKPTVQGLRKVPDGMVRCPQRQMLGRRIELATVKFTGRSANAMEKSVANRG
jgi:hypothetical protein